MGADKVIMFEAITPISLEAFHVDVQFKSILSGIQIHVRGKSTCKTTNMIVTLITNGMKTH